MQSQDEVHNYLLLNFKFETSFRGHRRSHRLLYRDFVLSTQGVPVPSTEDEFREPTPPPIFNSSSLSTSTPQRLFVPALSTPSPEDIQLLSETEASEILSETTPTERNASVSLHSMKKRKYGSQDPITVDGTPESTIAERPALQTKAAYWTEGILGQAVMDILQQEEAWMSDTILDFGIFTLIRQGVIPPEVGYISLWSDHILQTHLWNNVESTHVTPHGITIPMKIRHNARDTEFLQKEADRTRELVNMESPPRVIIFHIHSDQHWCLGIWEVYTGKMGILDSLPPRSTNRVNIKLESPAIKDRTSGVYYFSKLMWPTDNKIIAPNDVKSVPCLTQDGLSSCGLHCVGNAKSIMLNPRGWLYHIFESEKTTVNRELYGDLGLIPSAFAAQTLDWLRVEAKQFFDANT